MVHTNNPIIKHKAGLLNLAEELGNVSKACKVMGVSRDTFYRYQELVEEGGVDALINKSRRSPNLKNLFMTTMIAMRPLKGLSPNLDTLLAFNLFDFQAGQAYDSLCVGHRCYLY